jgi:hypothetical protein
MYRVSYHNAIRPSDPYVRDVAPLDSNTLLNMSLYLIVVCEATVTILASCPALVSISRISFLYSSHSLICVDNIC